MSQHNIL